MLGRVTVSVKATWRRLLSNDHNARNQISRYLPNDRSLISEACQQRQLLHCAAQTASVLYQAQARPSPACLQGVAEHEKRALASQPLPASVHVPPLGTSDDDAGSPISHEYGCQESWCFSFEHIISNPHNHHQDAKHRNFFRMDFSSVMLI